MVDRALNEFGHLDFAVNSAATPRRTSFPEMPMEQFDNVMNVNLRGVVLAMRAEIPTMLTNGSGAIVNVASVGGIVGVPGLFGLRHKQARRRWTHQECRARVCDQGQQNQRDRPPGDQHRNARLRNARTT